MRHLRRPTILMFAAVAITLAAAFHHTPAAAQTGNPIQTVFVIIFENHNWSEVLNNPAAPYINSLLANQTITLPEGFDQRKLTYHDPCYIGRYNDIFDEPRQVLKVLNSNGVTEMKRNRNKSFCCGGGGGRAWMEETIGKRVNQTRVNEALDTGAEVLAAACPFCITMFDDGIKGVEAEEKMQIEDISEIVVQAIEKSRIGASADYS